jgi:hypothetical protein
MPHQARRRQAGILQQGPQPPCGTCSSSWRHTWLAYLIFDTLAVRRLAQLAQVGRKGPCAPPAQVILQEAG